jgi:hypothetical protein
MVTDRVSVLTDDQITTLLSSYTRGRDLTDIFRDAARLGMLKAAEICDKIADDADEMRITATVDDCADAIRAAAGD